MFAALTGMRRGELCGLRWSDIDEETATVTVRRSVWQVRSEWGLKDTKSHRVRPFCSTRWRNRYSPLVGVGR